jgi:hypothetical protein
MDRCWALEPFSHPIAEGRRSSMRLAINIPDVNPPPIQSVGGFSNCSHRLRQIVEWGATMDFEVGSGKTAPFREKGPHV